MDKSHQTTKHKKQKKKELANRKDKQEQRCRTEVPEDLPERELVEYYEGKPDAPSMSPARRAFQDK